MRAAGRTLTVGELREAVAGLRDDDPVHLVVEGEDHDGYEGVPLLSVQTRLASARLAVDVGPRTALDDDVLDLVAELAGSRMLLKDARAQARYLCDNLGLPYNARIQRA